ncbi:cobyrinic acid a,c-diamide synthase [Deltaproteobacteria bacterium Smac51]|nr:cobyrinic acid a,c-diamide synthase [Deltaproteobacteria bacterium Smac51]
MLAGASSGVGKTSVSAGIMAALARRGLTVQPYKVGPDYIDPAFHTFVTGRKSRNLDSWMLDGPTICSLFLVNAPEPAQGISVIEGVMGMFDGHSQEDRGSTAHVAEILSAPVVLIINGASIARSAAALVHGFNTFKPGLRLAGVIVNMVAGEHHYELLKSFIEKEAGVPCFGFLTKNPEFSLESRHLGLVPSVEVQDLSDRLSALADSVDKTIDLDGLLALAASAPELECSSPVRRDAGLRPVRIGLALDNAFNFYYQDGLDLLGELGAELVPFSPVTDENLPPDLAGLYFGGGFPEVFAAELAANTSLRREILTALNNGLPAYAECGGLMYLGKRLTDYDGAEHEMVGFFPHRTAMTKRLQNFGYVEVTFDESTVLGPAGTKVKAHEFHHSKIIGEEPDYVLNIKKSTTRGWRGGVCAKNVLAAYPHIHFHANPALAENFVRQCRQYGESL